MLKPQCLNATKATVHQGLRTFFTTSCARADGQSPRRQSATASLSAIGDEPRLSPTGNYKSPFNTSSTGSRNSTSSTQQESLFGKRITRDQNSTNHDNVGRLLQRTDFTRRRMAANSQSFGNTRGVDRTADDMRREQLSSALSRQIWRRWKPGQVYAPHDLSDVEQMKWRKRDRPTRDMFDVLNFNPLTAYSNFSIMGEYMTPMGRIKHNKETGLRPVNQRKIAKAIRRSIGIGLMPSVYRHPEDLRLKMNQRQPN
ncbi:hypothetical protein B0O99DRAFT_643835 [Bisporella sp. PMI_857]|nr:hypothetical protein B0O99DRAFT_643835 [Bisporella sp. PMI_857]